MSEVLKTGFSGLIMQAQNSISNNSFAENLEEINGESEKENNRIVSNDTRNLIASTISFSVASNLTTIVPETQSSSD